MSISKDWIRVYNTVIKSDRIGIGIMRSAPREVEQGVTMTQYEG